MCWGDGLGGGKGLETSRGEARRCIRALSKGKRQHTPGPVMPNALYSRGMKTV